MSVTFEIRYYNSEALKQAERNGEPIPKEDWQFWGSYGTGKDAAERVEGLKEGMPDNTFTIIRNDPLAGDRDWLIREHGRMHDGTYKPIAGRFPQEMPEQFGQYWTPESYQTQFANVSFQQWLMEQNPSHVPHISQNNERKIAFTESMEKGRKDIQKALHAHEYLEKYLASSCRQYGPMDLIVEAMGGYNFQLLFASTATEMVETITECHTSREVGSCMSHPISHYACAPHHPFEAYALGGDLVLAYVRTDGDKGTIWGRALAWPERKIYGRIYSTNAALFRKIMAANGYEDRERTVLAGARLGVIRLGSEDSDRIVMPYIDGSQAAEWDGEELTITQYDGNTAAGNTDGTSYLGNNGTECDSCGTIYNDEEEGGYVEGHGNYCQRCCDNYTYWCEGNQEVYDHRHEPMRSIGGRIYCRAYFDENYFECEDCREDYHNDEYCYDEASNQSLCECCHANLLGKRDETLGIFAEIMTGNQLAPEPQPIQLRGFTAENIVPDLDIPDLSGLQAHDNETVPRGFVLWQPRRLGHAPKYLVDGRCISGLIQDRNDTVSAVYQNYWNFDAIDQFYVVPESVVYGPYAQAQAQAA